MWHLEMECTVVIEQRCLWVEGKPCCYPSTHGGEAESSDFTLISHCSQGAAWKNLFQLAGVCVPEPLECQL